MGNNSNFHAIQVPIEKLRLDRQNPRISLRPAADDRACIERLADGKAEQLYALGRDVAEKGLSVEPIVAIQDGAYWTVKDGNRRVAVLKMLANPLLAPDTIRSRIERLAETYPPLPDVVEIQTSDNLDAVIAYVHRRHSGAANGEGQLQWDSIEKAFFELSVGARGQHDLAVRILRYAQNEGIPFGHDFPITTLSRILTRDRVQVLGIGDLTTELPVLSASHEVVRERLATMIFEISSGLVHVRRGGEAGSVYEPIQQETYIQYLLTKHPGESQDSINPDEHIGFGAPISPNQQSAGADAIKNKQSSNVDVKEQEDRVRPAGQQGSTRPIKPSWDRDKVIQSMRLHSVNVPTVSENRKARNILVELKNISLTKSIIGPGMLVRSFLELSVDEYVGRNCLEKQAKAIASQENAKHPGLRHKMLACVEHMHSCRHIDSAEKKALRQRAQQNHVSIDTLHSIVHSSDFLPDIQTVNCFWDDLRGFFHHCWNS